MNIKYCMPVIPSFDLQKSMRFWVDGLGFAIDNKMEQDGKLVGCMVHHEAMFFWLNQRAGDTQPENYEGIRLYWTPENLIEIQTRLKNLGYSVSEIVTRDYGQTEFFVTDDDGYSHCFGVDGKDV